MPRDATLTRARLLRAAERRFARDGVAGARLRDVIRDAGQGNDSAVGYHFGSRQGLLEQIVAKHLAAMEQERAVLAEDATLDAIVAAIVVPTAERLHTEDGRDFLRITEQLAGWSGLGSGRPTPVLVGTILADQLRLLETRLRSRIGTAYARERVAALVTFLTASLADRARSIDAGTRQRLAHERYVDHLVRMLTGALRAD